jgi:hypothetical protein
MSFHCIYLVTTLIATYRCIQGLVRFAQPILDLISEATGWKTTLLAGGPEPAHGGRLNVIRYILIACFRVDGPHGFIAFTQELRAVM